LFCVRGALRSFAVGFDGAGKLVLTQKDDSLNPQTLAERDFNFTPGKSYVFAIEVKNKSVLVSVDGSPLIAYDAPRPLPSGAFGVRLERGSSARIDYFSVNKKPF
jgi:hypothetical protein